MAVVVRVDTNVSTSDVDKEFLVETTESLANTFKISKSVSICCNNFNLLLKAKYLNS